MTTINVSLERPVGAPTALVYNYLADYRTHHPRILPPAFSDYHVEEGGVGSGTVIRFRVTIGGRSRQARQRVDELIPGRVLRETDIDGNAVTTFTVTPHGSESLVRIETDYEGADGVSGFLERLIAPRLFRRLYADELTRLDQYCRREGSIVDLETARTPDDPA